MERRMNAAGLTVGSLREAYRSKKTTPEQVAAQIVERAERDAGMNIWITPPRMERIQPYLDRLADKDPERTPLWGIPFAIKDNIDLAGVPTTAGCPDYQYVPREHAAVVARLVEAGAIPVGKTNLDQFATGLVGVRSPYGETHNALKSELISGGSSSGSAVAVARGHAAFSLGTDTAGSGRVPAALNGIVGFKPSLGAWSTKGVVPACASLDCVNVFANSLADALEVDRIARGRVAGDPWSKDVPPPLPALPAKFLLPVGPLKFYGPYAAEYERAWRAAAKRIEALGLPIEHVSTELFEKAAELLYGGPFVEERWASLGSFVEAHPDSVLPVTAAILQSGSAAQYDGASVFKAIHALQAIKLETNRMLEGAVLVLPTAGGTWKREQVALDPIGTNSQMGAYTNHCNLLDLCGLAVPAGEAASGVPFGITMFGLSGEEGLAIGAAMRWEGADPGTMASKISNRTYIAVCGLHMRGYPLERQMKECGAKFVREARTAAKYALYKLPTDPPKPGMVKRTSGGGAIAVEIWEMPLDSFGAFAAGIPGPLGIGKVELEDGTEVPGFVCESYVAATAEDVTQFGGWRAVK
ncbi:allophanate hydrolase [Paenibacillaceae bacterium WGS1546]|uniref:allophanate hydrolase n=1 Tax=Cohnella sp. WGS1546 TaxID=3366810 RepID=UPI00372D2D87